MKLSIVVPTFNEEATIFEIIKRVDAVKLTGITKEIVVVDDASTDNSSLEIKKAEKKFNGVKSFRHKTNRGKGAALRTGFEHATGDIILVQDADLEYSPSEYPQLLAPIIDANAQVVYGTRLKNYPVKLIGHGRTPLVSHFLGNKFLTLLTNIFYNTTLTDMETCYKVFKKDAIKGIQIKSDRFEFEPEITAKILKRGIRIVEVPISVNPRGYDEGKKITWKDGFGAVWTLIKYRFTD